MLRRKIPNLLNKRVPRSSGLDGVDEGKSIRSFTSYLPCLGRVNLSRSTSNWHVGVSDLILERQNVNGSLGRKQKSEAPARHMLELGKGNLPVKWKATRMAMLDSGQSLHPLVRTTRSTVAYLDHKHLYVISPHVGALD